MCFLDLRLPASAHFNVFLRKRHEIGYFLTVSGASQGQATGTKLERQHTRVRERERDLGLSAK